MRSNPSKLALASAAIAIVALSLLQASTANAGTLSSASAVIPTPVNWKREPVTGRHVAFGGQVVDAYASAHASRGTILVIATTLGATITKSADGKTTTIDERVGVVPLRSYVTQLLENSGVGMHRISDADTRLCDGRPGMTATYLVPSRESAGSMNFAFAAQQSGPYIIEVLYMRAPGGAVDPAAIDAIGKLCVPAPHILQDAYGVHARN